MKLKYLIMSVVAMAAMVYWGCGSSSSSSSSDDSSTTSSSVADTAFPSTLALASPLDSEAATASLSADSALIKNAATTYTTAYDAAVAEIDAITSGTSTAACDFDPADFVASSTNAGCYGPSLDYENHPDGAGGSGELPPGDLGMWLATDTTTGNACAAAELNSRMTSIEARTVASLKAMASLLCVQLTGGGSLPVNTTVDVTSGMTALAISGVTFNSASISHSNASGSDVYSYDVDFTYVSGTTRDIVIGMDHTAGTSAGVYSGNLFYRVNDTFTGGGCPSNNVTQNGSVAYEGTATEVKVQAKEGMFCGHDVNAIVSNEVDVSDKYSVSNTDGWANSFSIFTANFDPDNMEGNYSYAWQAGPNDGHARVFDVHVADNSGSPTAFAYFGYGDDIASTDGGIEGFICNWAGPGNTKAYVDTAQYQSMTYNSTTGLYTAGTSNITYAPTNNCNHNGIGLFKYDTDADGLLTDESIGVTVTNNLIAGTATDSDADGRKIEETISATAFDLPVAP